MFETVVSGDKLRLGFYSSRYSVGTELQTAACPKGSYSKIKAERR